MNEKESDFRTLAELVAELVEIEACRLLVRPPVGPRFVWVVFDWDRPETKPLEGVPLQLVDELEIVLTAVVDGFGPAAVAEARSALGQDRRGDSQGDAAKYHAVEEFFPVTELRRRVWTKRTSKVDLLVTAEWELGLKAVDDDYATPLPGTPVPFGSVRLVLSPPDPVEEEMSLDSTTFMVDEEDVDFLLAALGRLKQVFRDNGPNPDGGSSS